MQSNSNSRHLHKPANVFHFFLRIIVFLLLFSSMLVGAEIHRSVTVIFNGTKVSLSPGKALHLCDTTTILSPEILQILEPYHEVYINRTFGDNDPDYVLVEGRDGIEVEKPTLKGVYILTFEDSASAERAVEELLHSEDVLSANQNGTVRYDVVSPNDALFGDQWSLNNTGQSGGTSNADINAPEAWEYGTGSSAVKIGVIDTGVWGAHEDLSGKVSGDGSNGNYHGTHVAGIAGAKTNNGSLGVAGINWVSQILSRSTDGDWGEIHDKILDAVDEGANVLNNSWAVKDNTLPPVLAKAFAYAHNMDRLSIASAGNEESSGPHYPSDLCKLISVSATDRFDLFASFSNSGSNVDVAAPGVGIKSTYSPSELYKIQSGTSMAAPHVTGVASLLKSYDPTLWNDDIRNIIQLSAFDANAASHPGWDPELGWGRLDADSAFELLQLPRTLSNTSSVSGSTYNYWISGPTTMLMYGVPGLADGVYIVKVYDVRRDVSFDRPYYVAPAVWGRGAASANSGLVFQNGLPVFNFRDCNAVSSSVTTTGCTMSTHVYEVWDYDGNPVGFKPVSPSSVVFPYSVLGEYELLEPTMTTVTTDFPNDRVLISWDDPNPNEDRIIVKRRPGDYGNWIEWEDMPQGDITSVYQTSLGQLIGSQVYNYKVVFLNYSQETSSSQAPVASFRNLANAPQNVSVWSSTYQGYRMPKTYVSWTAPANQLANSIDHYEVKVQYSPSDIRWYDTTTTTIEFCVDYDEDIQVTVYAVDDWEVQGRASSTIDFETPPMYEWTNCIPPGGGGNLTTPDSLEVGKLTLPTAFELEQNFPNPFNPVTAIAFSVPSACETRIEVFNMMGQHIRTLFDGALAAGKHQFEWDSRDDAGTPVSSGVYFYRVDAGAFSETRKMLLLK